jgi:hypothetical protein
MNYEGQTSCQGMVERQQVFFGKTDRPSLLPVAVLLSGIVRTSQYSIIKLLS